MAAVSTINRFLWLVRIAFLVGVSGTASQQFCAAAETNTRERPYNIERKARLIAKAVEDLGVVLPEGELLDVTKPLSAAGIAPGYAAPDYPSKFALPTKIYASALPGGCPGAAIVGVQEVPDRSMNYSYISLVADNGSFAFRGDLLSHDDVIELIADLTAAEIGSC